MKDNTIDISEDLNIETSTKTKNDRKGGVLAIISKKTKKYNIKKEKCPNKDIIQINNNFG